MSAEPLVEVDEAWGKIVTFYSYKGGVGRSMALANIAVLLAQMGKKVLVVDWDLEAPGIDRFFEQQAVTPPMVAGGLMRELRRAQAAGRGQGGDAGVFPAAGVYSTVTLAHGQTITILPSGDSEASYSNDVATFSWSEFFTRNDGGKVIETMRQSWRRNFDFTLIDSRTGITDSGGVCTVQLPDYLVLVFAANDQNLDGAERVVRGVHAARAEFAYDRQRLMVIPLLSRFDGRAEKASSDKWLAKCASKMKPLLNEWLPESTSPLNYFDKTKLPHIPKYAFGEQLAVLEERATDTDALTYYYSAVARLIAGHLQRADHLLALPRNMSSEEKAGIFRRSEEWKKSRATVQEIEQLIATLPAAAHAQAEAMRDQIRNLAPSDPTLRDDLATLVRSTTDTAERDKALEYLKLIDDGKPSEFDDKTPPPLGAVTGQATVTEGKVFLLVLYWVAGTWLGIIPYVGTRLQDVVRRARNVSIKPRKVHFGYGSFFLALIVIGYVEARANIPNYRYSYDSSWSYIGPSSDIRAVIGWLYLIGSSLFLVRQQFAFAGVLRWRWLAIFPILIMGGIGLADPFSSLLYVPLLLTILSALHLTLFSRPKAAAVPRK